MSKAPFKVDGIAYDVIVPAGGIRRSAAVLDGKNAGRTQGGTMSRDIIGTYYNYTVELDTKQTRVEEYDRLYDVLTAPVDSHSLEIPYNQETLLFRAYVTGAEDTLTNIQNGINIWGGLSITFTAMAPQRRP